MVLLKKICRSNVKLMNLKVRVKLSQNVVVIRGEQRPGPSGAYLTTALHLV